MIIGLSMKEQDQLVTFNKLKEGIISQKIAAKVLKVSTRWVRKKYKRFIERGSAGLVHGNRGRPSSRVWQAEQRTYVMQILEGPFRGFGPTFAAEKLDAMYQIKVSAETLRKAMIAAGLWHGKTRKVKHRALRERKAMYGVMVQLDGSPHDWFEGRGPYCTLLVFIEDATSQLLWLEFVPSESLESVAMATRRYLEMYGRPGSFYVDYGSVFSVNTNNPEREKISQFERMCDELSIDIIHAGSPQAKGRVERANRTLQDRLVKELRLAGISNMQEANAFVRNVYIAEHNRMFAIQAFEQGNAHRPISHYDLDSIFCIKDSRKIQNDFVIQYKKQLIQLTAHQKAVIRPREDVLIHESFSGKLSLFIRSIQLDYTYLWRRPRNLTPPSVKREWFHKPAKDHPWRRGYQNVVSATANGGC